MTHQENNAATSGARDEWRYAKLALAWHGWGSPIGLAAFLLALSASGVLLCLAIAGH